MNPIVILTKNNLQLTKRCIESITNQDIPLRIFIGDNGSTDGTPSWISEQENIEYAVLWSENRGVSFGWNYLFERAFSIPDVTHVFCVGNDTWLPRGFCRRLIERKLRFVTGVAVDNMGQALQEGDDSLSENPDFSAYCIRRDCWDAVGPFDESMRLYVQDCDFHARAHRLGIRLYKATTPYYHIPSATMRYATIEDRNKIQEQANKDRQVFFQRYNCLPGTPQYDMLFSPELFGIDKSCVA